METFTATTSHVAHMAAVLSSLMGVGTQGSVYFSAEGLVFSCHSVQTVQASVTFDKTLFETFTFHGGDTDGEAGGEAGGADDTDVSEDSESAAELQGYASTVRQIRRHTRQSVRICVDLRSIVECLNVVSSAGRGGTSGRDAVPEGQIRCTLSYRSHGYPFVVQFRDSLMTERCEFQTFVDTDVAPERQALQLDAASVIMETSVSAEAVHDALASLRDLKSEELYIYAATHSTDQRTLHGTRVAQDSLMFVTKSDIGLSRFTFTNVDHLELWKYDELELSYQRVQNDFVVSIFKFEMVQKLVRAVRLGHKVWFRKDANGVMSVRLLSELSAEPRDVNAQRWNMRAEKPDKAANGANVANGSRYAGTVIEFLLLELVVEDEDEEAIMDKNEIVEMISAITFDKSAHRQSGQRRHDGQDSAARKRAPAVGDSQRVLDIFAQKERNTEPGNESRGIVNINRNINDVLHTVIEKNAQQDLFF